MAQATLSCRFAAIHLVTPLLGFFRNYLPSRIRTLFAFFDNLSSEELWLFGLFCLAFCLCVFAFASCAAILDSARTVWYDSQTMPQRCAAKKFSDGAIKIAGEALFW